jgi:acyl-CoA thioesterase FadM
MRIVNLGRPTDRKPPFKFSALTRVGFSDTDAQGIVYYGRYLPYFDDARVEYHRHLDLLAFDHGPSEFVMRASNVLYEAPARFDDLLEVFEQTMVLVELAERCPTPIPEGYKQVISAFEGADLELAVPR